MSTAGPTHVHSEMHQGADSSAHAFTEGLKAEIAGAGHHPEGPPEAIRDDRLMNLVEEIKARVMLLMGMDDPKYDEPGGLRFVSLHLREGLAIKSEQIVAALRRRPHLDHDHLLRVARDPRTDDWLICVQPRNRMTRFGIEYWLRNESLDQDRAALQGICLDLRNTSHNLRVWMSTEPLTREDQARIHDLFRDLQSEIPEYSGGGNRLDLRVPLEARHYLPPNIRLKEDYVILGPIVDPVPRTQEDRELADIERKLEHIKNHPSETERRVTVMIYRHALTIRVINALNRFRSIPENAGLLHIMGRPDIREQYPQLFAPIDTRRKIEAVSADELPQPLPKRTRRHERSRSWWIPAPSPKREDLVAAPSADEGSHLRVDPDMVRVVKEVRRAERAERAKRGWGGWLSGWVRRRK